MLKTGFYFKFLKLSYITFYVYYYIILLFYIKEYYAIHPECKILLVLHFLVLVSSHLDSPDIYDVAMFVAL